jgi:galactarate dehydratase
MHPNTYGALIVSLGCQQINTDWIAEPIAAAGREVHKVCLQTDGGFYNSVAAGIRLVTEMKDRASQEQRVDIPITELVMGSHCGGSDWTSGLSANRVCGGMLDIHEAVGGTVVHTAGRGNLIANCGTLDILERMVETGNNFRAYNKTRNGKGMSETNPTPGNKKGGLSNIVEKAMGSIAKSGTSPIVEVLSPAERPTRHGEIFAATPASDIVCGPCQMASGIGLQVFMTGRGTPYNLAAVPVIKVCSRNELKEQWPDIIDISAGAVATGEKTIAEVGTEIFDKIIACARGRDKPFAEKYRMYN